MIIIVEAISFFYKNVLANRQILIKFDKSKYKFALKLSHFFYSRNENKNQIKIYWICMKLSFFDQREKEGHKWLLQCQLREERKSRVNFCIQNKQISI